MKCGEKIVEDLGDEDAKAVEKGALRRSELLFQLTRDSLRNGKRVRRYIVISHGRKAVLTHQ